MKTWVGGVAPSENTLTFIVPTFQFLGNFRRIKMYGMCYKVGEESDFNTSTVNLSSR